MTNSLIQSTTETWNAISARVRAASASLGLVGGWVAGWLAGWVSFRSVVLG